MNAKYPINALIVLSTVFTACVTIPLPNVVIPEEGRKFSPTLLWGNNGLEADLCFAPGKMFVLNLKGNFSIIPRAVPYSASAEAGMGWVNSTRKWMVYANYGRGVYAMKDNPYYIGEIWDSYSMKGGLEKLSLGVNYKFHPHLGLVVAASTTWFKATKKHYDFDADTYEQYNTGYREMLGMDAVLYCEFGPANAWKICSGLSRTLVHGSTDPRQFFYSDYRYRTPAYMAAVHTF